MTRKELNNLERIRRLREKSKDCLMINSWRLSKNEFFQARPSFPPDKRKLAIGNKWVTSNPLKSKNEKSSNIKLQFRFHESWSKFNPLFFVVCLKMFLNLSIMIIFIYLDFSDIMGGLISYRYMKIFGWPIFWNVWISFMRKLVQGYQHKLHNY